MNDIIGKLTESVTKLENEFDTAIKGNKESSEEFKERSLELLAKLKRAQDDPANEEYDDDFEDLIFKVIYIVGQL